MICVYDDGSARGKERGTANVNDTVEQLTQVKEALDLMCRDSSQHWCTRAQLHQCCDPVKHGANITRIPSSPVTFQQ